MSAQPIDPPPTAVARDPHWAAKRARLKARQLPFRRLRVQLDSRSLAIALAEAKADHLDLTKALRAAQGLDEALQRQAAVALERVTAAQAAVDADVVDLDFEGLRREDYEELIGEHPPTQDQLDGGMEYNVETFAPALLSACSLDGMPEEDALELLSDLSQVEAGLIFDTCIALCETARMSVVTNAQRRP